MVSQSFVVSVDNDSEAFDREWVRAVRQATLRFIEPEVVEMSIDSMSAALDCHKLNLRFDSIFIDACHEYAECKSDIQAWMPLLNPGGIICGHDYWAAHIGVMNAVNDVFGENFAVVPQTRIWFARPIIG
jgi:predicted O-methyltransferase YrrM